MADPGNVKDSTGSSTKSMDGKPDMTKRANAADHTGSEIVLKDAKAKASYTGETKPDDKKPTGNPKPSQK